MDERGFSLLETILYSALLSLLIVSIVEIINVTTHTLVVTQHAFYAQE
jgi:competence protein ComGC